MSSLGATSSTATGVIPFPEPATAAVSFPDTFQGFAMAGFCHAASQEGGDFYDILSSETASALLVIGDVMGKGTPAARIAASLRRAIRRVAGKTQRLSEILAQVNELVFEELSTADAFATVQLALLNSHQEVLEICSAGHCPLLTVSRAGMVRAFAPKGMPLGIAPDARYTEESLPLQHLGSLLMYTDGVTEARDSSGRLLGSQWLEDWLERETACGGTAPQLTPRLVAELNRFQGNALPWDDQAFLLATREEPAKSQLLALEPATVSEPGSLQAAA